MHKMRKLMIGALLGVGAVLALTHVAAAQTPPVNAATPPQAGDRFRFNPVEGGMLRLDSQTGKVSFCRPRDASWSCETVADDRAAYETEIARLERRITELERLSNDPANRFRTPSDAEIDQAMSMFERMMKRFRGVVETLRREWDSPSAGRS